MLSIKFFYKIQLDVKELINTAKNIQRFRSYRDFFSECKQTLYYLRICSHLLKIKYDFSCGATRTGKQSFLRKIKTKKILINARNAKVGFKNSVQPTNHFEECVLSKMLSPKKSHMTSRKKSQQVLHSIYFVNEQFRFVIPFVSQQFSRLKQIFISDAIILISGC